MFAYPSTAGDWTVAPAVAAYTELAWVSRDDPEPVLPMLVSTRVDALVAGRRCLWYFKCALVGAIWIFLPQANVPFI